MSRPFLISIAGHTCSGDTLAERLEQAAILSNTAVKNAVAELGYRGPEVDGTRILHRGKPKRMSKAEKRLLKRRQAVELSIGHLKADRPMRRNFLKGAVGEAMNPILATAGFNRRWLIIVWRRVSSCHCWIRAARIPAQVLHKQPRTGNFRLGSFAVHITTPCSRYSCLARLMAGVRCHVPDDYEPVDKTTQAARRASFSWL